ncbi:MAG: hypothetical protein HC896_04710 [Bacteroidales bacterium]|nr:hypothetical protein [Bacteroidales bacterium]
MRFCTKKAVIFAITHNKDMSIQNKPFSVLMPIVISLSIIAGIFIGISFNRKPVDSRFIIYPRVDKLNSVLDYIEDRIRRFG